MLTLLKNKTLGAAKSLGLYHAVAGSSWRRQRVMILGYHGIALKDENQWRNLYLTPAHLRSRFEILARGRYRLLPLNDAVAMLREGSLPPRSVVLTFDDGFHDFHAAAFPLLREFGFPATVYQTTYYCDHHFPIFNLALSYVFWLGRTRQLDGNAYGVSGVFDLSTDAVRDRAMQAFLELARLKDYSPSRKNQLTAELAGALGVDYSEILGLRLLQLMTPDQVSEIAAAGIDVQLHTHRHRTPRDEKLFVREIRDNRQWLATRVGNQLNHFCYPSGVHFPEFLPWLRSEGVKSATTCDLGIAGPSSEPLLLPRLLDSMNVTALDFEGWLAGVSSLLPHRGV